MEDATITGHNKVTLLLFIGQKCNCIFSQDDMFTVDLLFNFHAQYLSRQLLAEPKNGNWWLH